MKYSIEQLKKECKAKKVKLEFFWGHKPGKDGMISKSCLSQWWISEFIIDKVTYSSCEQYMMASKARLFNDYVILDKIIATKDPKVIKALGREIKGFNEATWNENKYRIVLEGNIAKFSQNEKLKEFLLSMKNKVLVEASPYDKIWGIGMAQNDLGVDNPENWKGENLLGFALMEARDIIVEGVKVQGL